MTDNDSVNFQEITRNPEKSFLLIIKTIYYVFNEQTSMVWNHYCDILKEHSGMSTVLQINHANILLQVKVFFTKKYIFLQFIEN